MSILVDESSTLEIPYLDWQCRLFDNPAKWKVCPKGRRSGLTRGYAHHVIEQLLAGVSPILWVDTINSNIDRYVERYMYPILHKIKRQHWQWRQQKKELCVLGNVLDMRSADSPESIEGFGYKAIFVNEAGLILNDPYLWQNAILPMCLDYDPVVYIGGVPKGKRDKHGERHIFYDLAERARMDTTGKYAFMRATYRDNKHLNKSAIDELLKSIPPNVAEQEIEGQFIDSAQQLIFNPAWWQYHDGVDLSSAMRVTQSWDTAFKEGEENDFSICETWAQVGRNHLLIDRWRGRVAYPDLQAKAIELYGRYHPSIVLIEDKASGQSLVQTLQRCSSPRIPVRPIKVDRDKVSRANACTWLLSEKRVFIPRNVPWLYEFVNEHEVFPTGEHDDQVDATTQYLNFAGKQISTNDVSNYEF